MIVGRSRFERPDLSEAIEDGVSPSLNGDNLALKAAAKPPGDLLARSRRAKTILSLYLSKKLFQGGGGTMSTPTGFLPTRAVAVTVSLAVSITETLLEVKFVT
jgi:hypothetical protein